MIDKIAIHLKHGDFSLVEGAEFMVVKPTLNTSTGEEYKGFEYSGITVSRAYVSGKNFNLNITNYGAYINFNPVKMIYGHNCAALTYSQFTEAINTLKDEVKEFITTNLGEAEIQKLELPCDTLLDADATLNIGQLWNSLDSQYLTHKQAKGGHYIGNSTREYSFYDKSKELNDKLGLDIGEDVFRVELKLLNKKKIQELTPLKYLKDLCIEKRYNSLPSCFHSAFEKDFRVSLATLLVPSRDKEIIEVLRAKYKKGFMDRYWDVSNGLDGILKKHGGITGYREFMKSIGLSKDMVKVQIRKVKSLIEVKGLVST
jgi:hypothetical protein